MGKIYCLLGKSSSGKDTIYKLLLDRDDLALKHIVPYTTRPIRSGEQEGVEYHFATEEQVQELEAAGRIIELRAYHTVLGVWKYFTVDDGQIDLAHKDYLIIGTLESYLKIREYYGKDQVCPIYLSVDDGIRLSRALERERAQEEPKYAELCRRFLADEEDFSDKNRAAAGINRIFYNQQLEDTVEEIAAYMRCSISG